MKIWHEGNTLYYDLEYNGVRPQCIWLETNIISVELIGNDVHVKGETANFIVQNIDNPNITRTVLVSVCEQEDEPLTNKIIGKHEEEVTVLFNGSYISVHIKTDHHEEVEALLFEQGALDMIEQLKHAVEEMRKVSQ